jgi:predicted RNase H-like HicB family nuclease
MKTEHKNIQDLLNVVVRKGEDGYFVAECLEIPGCMSQGQTEEEAVKNALDAIKACLGVMLEDFLKRARQSAPTNLVGIEKQEVFRVAPPELEAVDA